MFLPEDALLVSLHIEMRGISARSRTLSREAAEAHDAESDSVRGIVQKLGSNSIAPLQKIINEARAFHLRNTLPWGERGERLIPVTRYAHWKRELTRMQNAYMDEVENLVRRHASLRKDYVRRVNDLAQEIPFPTLEQLKGNFDFELIEEQIGNPDDLRLKHVDAKTVEQLRKKITSATEERLDEAHKDIINRLYEVVARVHEQTSKEKGRLFETLISNIEEAVDVLPNLNLRDDPEIKRLIARVRTELTSIDVETLRADPKERSKTARLTKSILGELKSYSVTSKPASRPRTRVASKVEVAAITVTKDTTAKARSMNSRLANVAV